MPQGELRLQRKQEKTGGDAIEERDRLTFSKRLQQSFQFHFPLPFDLRADFYLLIAIMLLSWL